MNKVFLTGRLTRDPEMRALASGKSVTQFSIATNEYAGNGKERAEYHNVVTWDRAGLFYKLAGAFSMAGLSILVGDVRDGLGVHARQRHMRRRRSRR